MGNTQSLKKITELAQSGNAEAQYKLGVFFFCGTNTPKDVKKSAEWHFKARENGYKPIVFVKNGMEFEPSQDMLASIYAQMDKWEIKHKYSYSYTCYAGDGDDFSSKGEKRYPIINSSNDVIAKKIIVNGSDFAGVEIDGSAYRSYIHATLYTNGKIDGNNSRYDWCERMDGPEDYSYDDEYTLVK